jgi:RNA polymerase sigma factor (sigma-70 family)
MMAMVLGTALAALGSPAQGSEAVSPQALHDITRYCTACWRNARLPVDRWGDCTQEVFQRLLERVPRERWLAVFAADAEEHAEFVRAIDTIKKRVQRDRKLSAPTREVADRREQRAQELRETRALLQEAMIFTLSRRQQRILDWTRAGWSVGEIAGELGLPPARISDEKYKAIHKLRAHFGSA